MNWSRMDRAAFCAVSWALAGLAIAGGVVARADAAAYQSAHDTRIAPPARGVDRHPVVPAAARFADSGRVSSVQLGRLLTQELGCVACHARDGLVGKQGPVLTDVASRVREEYLRAFIADPTGTKPGTTMPGLFEHASPEQRESAAVSLSHYLMSLTDRRPPSEYAPTGGRRRGAKLYRSVGCAACHDPDAGRASRLRTSTPLGDLDAKYTQASLARFLHDPLKARPSGRMPNVGLSVSQARDIAAHLLPPGRERPGIQYAYYEGALDGFPEFQRREPHAGGTTRAIGAGLGGWHGPFGLRFTGVLPVDRAGEYGFYIRSDGEARLMVDGQAVVHQGGENGTSASRARVELDAGRHDIAVEYMAREPEQEFESSPDDGEADPGSAYDATAADEAWRNADELEDHRIDADQDIGLVVLYGSAGGDAGDLDRSLLAATGARPQAEPPTELDPQLVSAGRRLFVSVGCASCHEVQDAGERVVSGLRPPPFDALSDGGCLSDGAAGIPVYALSDGQRSHIRAYLAAGSPGATAAGPDSAAVDDPIQHAMLTYDCFACHARDGLGGVAQERDAYFETTQREAGDEARIPPSLDGVGAKLKRDSLARIVANGAKDRPYMLTHMPGFGADGARELANELSAANHAPPLPRAPLDVLSAKSHGRDIVGREGMACISCHPFGRNRATAIQAMDLAIMARRLREDWFRRYVRDPQAYRGVTRMPTSWPTDGPSILSDVLNGDSEKQVQAVWHYLSDGPDAKTPPGIGREHQELVPEDEVIVYRNFIEGAGPRAIGVGFPEGVHIAFDANDSRLALIWRGACIDAGRHWGGRGEGFQAPLGSDVQALVEGVALARLPHDDAPWPDATGKELGVIFRGYRLSHDQRPTFRYSLDRLTVEDTPNPVRVGSGIALRRRIEFGGAGDAGVWFRAARGTMTAIGDGLYEVDDLRMRVDTTGGPPVLRTRDGVSELLLPVSATTAITQTFEFLADDASTPSAARRERR